MLLSWVDFLWVSGLVWVLLLSFGWLGFGGAACVYTAHAAAWFLLQTTPAKSVSLLKAVSFWLEDNRSSKGSGKRAAKDILRGGAMVELSGNGHCPELTVPCVREGNRKGDIVLFTKQPLSHYGELTVVINISGPSSETMDTWKTVFLFPSSLLETELQEVPPWMLFLFFKMCHDVQQKVWCTSVIIKDIARSLHIFRVLKFEWFRFVIQEDLCCSAELIFQSEMCLSLKIVCAKQTSHPATTRKFPLDSC